MRMSRRVLIAGVVMLAVVAGIAREARGQATSKPQFVWNQQEREAVDVVKLWVGAWAEKNPQRMAQLMAESVVFRSNPTEPLQKGRDAFQAVVARSFHDVTRAEIEEIYVTGAEWDTTVLIKRIDYRTSNDGRGVTVAAFFRVKNKQITEWLDTPVASAGPTPPAQPGR
jgi:Ketosteroid isomerase-related protein